MFSGTVFVQRREPDPELKLPRSCWAVYDRLDGTTGIGEIADALGLSQPEVFATVRQLQQRDLIEEPTISYSAYQAGATDEERDQDSADNNQSLPEMSGDGAGEVNRSAADTDEESAESDQSLHFPTLWNWLEETTDNVKAYKNTQAFVLMEASDALEAVGVGNMEDLEELDHCSDPEVIQALETAIENNVNERIPDRCYR